MVKKLTIWSNRLIGLNFGPSCRSNFFLWNNSSRAKIEVKMDEISLKHQNLNSNSLFSDQICCFWTNFTQKSVPSGQELKQSDWTSLKYQVLSTSHKKGLMISTTDWKGINILRKTSHNFLHFITSPPNVISWWL